MQITSHIISNFKNTVTFIQQNITKNIKIFFFIFFLDQDNDFWGVAYDILLIFRSFDWLWRLEGGEKIIATRGTVTPVDWTIKSVYNGQSKYKQSAYFRWIYWSFLQFFWATLSYRLPSKLFNEWLLKAGVTVHYVMHMWMFVIWTISTTADIVMKMFKTILNPKTCGISTFLL